MRIGAAEDPRSQHPGENEVGGVLGASGNFFRAVDHRHIGADIAHRGDVVHGVSPAAQSEAACFTASMILT